MTEKEKEKSRKRQLNRQNEFIKNNYDKITIVLKKPLKDTIKENRINTGQYKSINDYINRLIENDLNNNTIEKD